MKAVKYRKNAKCRKILIKKTLNVMMTSPYK